MNSKTESVSVKIHHKYKDAVKTTSKSSNTAQPLGSDSYVLSEIIEYAYLIKCEDPARVKKYRKWWLRLKQKHSMSDVQIYSVLEFLPNSLSQDFRSDRVPSRKLKEMISAFLECYERAFVDPKDGLTLFLSYLLNYKTTNEPIDVIEVFREYYGHYFLLSLFLHPTIEYEARVNPIFSQKILDTVERIKRPHRISNRLGYKEYNYLAIRTKQIYTNAHHKIGTTK